MSLISCTIFRSRQLLNSWFNSFNVLLCGQNMAAKPSRAEYFIPLQRCFQAHVIRKPRSMYCTLCRASVADGNPEVRGEYWKSCGCLPLSNLVLELNRNLWYWCASANVKFDSCPQFVSPIADGLFWDWSWKERGSTSRGSILICGRQ